jgi:ribosome-associated translation inhibitor RaiA
MHIQINTDRNIQGREELANRVTSVIQSNLRRFSDRISRVEAHLSDQNSDKGGEDDKRCLLEARVEGRPPTAVSHQAASVDQAVDGAVDKLVRLLDSTFARERAQR